VAGVGDDLQRGVRQIRAELSLRRHAGDRIAAAEQEQRGGARLLQASIHVVSRRGQREHQQVAAFRRKCPERAVERRDAIAMFATKFR
jgi:hypothetical protein